MNLMMSKFSTGGVLAGAALGMNVFGSVMKATIDEPMEPEFLEFDFANVIVATASFLRESILAVRNAVRSRGSNYYPVIVDANQAIIDDLAELADLRNEVFVCCSRDNEGQLISFKLVGRLEAKQKATLELVKRHRITDAAQLMKVYGPSEGISSPTAWNNRLASLASIGLIAEKRLGRLKKYQMLFDGVI